MALLKITIHSRKNKRNELLNTCRFITHQARQQHGCQSSRLSQDSDNEDLITIEQQWEQPRTLDNYFRSDQFSALLGAMKWLGRTYEIRINGGSQEEGWAAVKRARER